MGRLPIARRAEPERRVRPIAFDAYAPRRAIARTVEVEARYLLLGIALGADHDAERGKRFEGEVDIRLALKRAGDLDDALLPKKRQGKEKARHVLGAHVPRKQEGARTQAIACREGEASCCRQVAARGQELVDEWREGSLAKACRTDEGGVGAERAGDRKHEAQG